MSKLHGREVLIVEDQPLILMDIAHALRQLGAKPTMASTLKQALAAVEHEGLAAAILDHGLPDGDSSILCDKLDARQVPFVIYSGHARINGSCANGTLVEKPASTAQFSFERGLCRQQVLYCGARTHAGAGLAGGSTKIRYQLLALNP